MSNNPYIFSEYTYLAFAVALISLFPLFAIKGNQGRYICGLILACSIFTLTKMANTEIEYHYKIQAASEYLELDRLLLDTTTTSSICAK